MAKILTTVKKDSKIPVKLKKIIGIVKLPKEFNEKSELYNYFAKKHLR